MMRRGIYEFPVMATGGLQSKPKSNTDTNRTDDKSKNSAGPSHAVSAAQRAFNFVQTGSRLIKVRSKYSKNARQFQVVDGGMFLTYDGSNNALCHSKRQNKKFKIYDIQEIRRGIAASDTFVIAYPKNRPEDSRCFSLVIGGDGEVLDLVARSEEERDLWVSGIQQCLNNVKAHVGNPEQVLERWGMELFREADRDDSNTLSVKEITHLLHDMNFDVDEDDTALFSKNRPMNFNEFMDFLKKILKQEQIEHLFKKYDGNKNSYWTKDELFAFMTSEQGEKVTSEECETLLAENETCPVFKGKKQLSLAGFTSFFDSDRMSIKNPKCQQVYQDMNQPLSHYFIDSSHNTYLESDQLKGYSKTECYIRALKSGCRCVELDVWDGSDCEPTVHHGYTLTTKILLVDVIKAVNKYAFHKSKYPLILSIENHCSAEQQVVMADHLKRILGGKLFVAELLDRSNYLPSPAELMGKIVIKCKKIPNSAGRIGVEVFSVTAHLQLVDAAEDSEDEPDGLEENEKQQHDIVQEFSDLINICQTARFKSFEDSKVNQDFRFILSFSEKKALKLLKKMPEAFIQHNKRQLSRIYPSGSRVGSTNYDPVPFWTVGCQLVALNYQTPDEAMQLNKGLFEDNGNCGYVLKPEFMRSFKSKATFSPESFLPASRENVLKITILSGFCLPKKEGDKSRSILDPYVQVSITGVPGDRKTYKTKVIRDNGFNPVWNEEFKFFVTCPSLALLHILVIDDETTGSDVPIAQYCLPYQCIQKGYRTVRLKSLTGERLPTAKLYVRTSIS